MRPAGRLNQTGGPRMAAASVRVAAYIEVCRIRGKGDPFGQLHRLSDMSPAAGAFSIGTLRRTAGTLARLGYCPPHAPLTATRPAAARRLFRPACPRGADISRALFDSLYLRVFVVVRFYLFLPPSPSLSFPRSHQALCHWPGD